VVITGLGVVSCLGNDIESVAEALRGGRSGLETIAAWRDAGLRSTVGGPVRDLDAQAARWGLAPRDVLPLSRAALYAILATHQALADADLPPAALSQPRSAVLLGSGVGDTTTIHDSAALARAGKSRRIEPYAIVKSMSSAPAAAVTRRFAAGGRSYALSSACASAAHAIGHATELIRAGSIDVAIVGGSEHIDELIAAGFDALRMALSTRFNDRPAAASRPFAADRDGFVLASGAGILILEAAGHASRRGARARAEVLGYGTNSDPFDLVLPEPTGARAAECMALALADAGVEPSAVGAVNAHATATAAGDPAEAAALRRVFGTALPPIASSKGAGGHALGASGAHEAIHAVLQIERGFLMPSLNSEPRDPALADLPVVTGGRSAVVPNVLSNSFGFGGANASLLFGAAPPEPIDEA
jgi:3-oxoacyl-[acyl-carrier-protein] synthase-1